MEHKRVRYGTAICGINSPLTNTVSSAAPDRA